MRRLLLLLLTLILIVSLSTAAGCSSSKNAEDLRKAEEMRAKAEADLNKARADLEVEKARVAKLEAALAKKTSGASGSTTNQSGSSSSSSSSGLRTPGKGSAERQAILDAVRVKINWSKLFKVEKLKVKEGWAYGVLQQYDSANPGNAYESFSTLLHQVGGAWKCLFAVGGSDAVSIQEQTGLKIPQYLHKKYPAAPEEIFE